jgi:hypothetical protein
MMHTPMRSLTETAVRTAASLGLVTVLVLVPVRATAADEPHDPAWAALQEGSLALSALVRERQSLATDGQAVELLLDLVSVATPLVGAGADDDPDSGHTH